MPAVSKRQNDYMMAFSLNLANEQEPISLAELVADFRSVAPDIKILLVGALARDLLFFHSHGIRAGRATEDVDSGWRFPT